MIERLRKRLALLLSVALCLSFSPVAADAAEIAFDTANDPVPVILNDTGEDLGFSPLGDTGDGGMITISKRAPVDIVFVLDSTGSMGTVIGKVKDNIKSFLDKLYDYNRRISEGSDKGIGIDPRIAIVDYKDVTNSGEATTFHKNGDDSYWFVKTGDTDDGEMLAATVSGIKASGGGDGPETPTEALAKLYKADDGVDDVEGFEWRSDAQKFVFLVTDEDFKERASSSSIPIPDMSEVIEELSKLDIHTSVVTGKRLGDGAGSRYHSLYTETGGEWYDLGGELKFMEDIIEHFSDKLNNTVVNVSVNASGAPEGIGSVRLVRYIDNDGVEQTGPVVYCGDVSSASVSVSWCSLVEIEINANEVREGITVSDGNTYVIDELTINGEPQDLSGSDGSIYRVYDLEIIADTTIQALFTADEGTEEEPDEREEKPTLYTVSFDSKGGSPVPPQNVAEGEKATEPDSPKRDGYSFNHWYMYDEKKPYDFGIPVSSDFTLTASWSPSDKKKEGSVSEDKQEENEGSVSEDKQEEKEGSVSEDKQEEKEGSVSENKQEGDGEENEEGKEQYNSDKPEDAVNPDNDEAPAGIPSDWTKLKHVTHENSISSNYCVIARKQRFDVKPYISGAVVYKSSNRRIASVGKKNGIVKGKKTGDALITGYVRSGRQLIPTGSYTIHVVTPEVNRKQYLSFNTDGSIDGNEHIVNEVLSPTIWKSSNPSVATVSSNSGNISVLKSKGKVKITAFYGLGRNAAKYRFTLRIRPSGGVGRYNL